MILGSATHAATTPTLQRSAHPVPASVQMATSTISSAAIVPKAGPAPMVRSSIQAFRITITGTVNAAPIRSHDATMVAAAPKSGIRFLTPQRPEKIAHEPSREHAYKDDVAAEEHHLRGGVLGSEDGKADHEHEGGEEDCQHGGR